MPKLTEKDIESAVRELALTDTKRLVEQFLDQKKFVVCMHRKKNQSLQQIANILGMPRSTVASICRRC